MHGHEPLDTDNTAPRFVGETWLLKHNFAQAEGVANLDQVPEAGALIAIGFAKFQGGTGAFARYPMARRLTKFPEPRCPRMRSRFGADLMEC